MASAPSSAAARLNLSGAAVLVVESNRAEMDIFVQVLSGLGAGALRCADSAEAAMKLADVAAFDLFIIDATLSDGDGHDLVRLLRRCANETNRLAPVILVAGHTGKSKVAAARDCGANFVVAKPITPQVLFERILWVTQDKRAFVQADTYSGPDRRFRMLGPPPGEAGRRETDLPAEVGATAGVNMSQNDIDALLKPQKVSA